ncbi:MAG: MBL fold metallo-hydrolase [Chloroflexota bacterium]|nr:MBL fold metallo-hydrolase [Chloroflexota bacterium]
MKLTIVGCAAAWTRRPGVASSCYLVELGRAAVLLDLGQGAFSELARYRDPASIAAVLVSHLHADHLVDVVPLRHYLKFEAQRTSDVHLRGPAELRPRLDAFQAESGFLDVMPGEPLEPGEFELRGFAVRARHVTHIEDSFAFRLSPVGRAGPGLVYSGDCARADDLLPLIEEGDTLLCEAAFGSADGGGGGHLTARQAAGAASRAGAGQLILTHILDRHDEEAARKAAGDVFGGPVSVARPGRSFELA